MEGTLKCVVQRASALFFLRLYSLRMQSVTDAQQRCGTTDSVQSEMGAEAGEGARSGKGSGNYGGKK